MGDQEKQTADVMVNRPIAYGTAMPDGSAWPRISIVTPNYNYAHYVGDTLYSVISQGYPNLEYIVIDDGSTDGSYEEILKCKPWLAHCERQGNMGQARTLNKGFAMSSGEIMAWLNSDDKYLPWTFGVVAEIFRRFPEIEWITGIPTSWDCIGRNVGVYQHIRKNIYSFCLDRYGWIQQESVFWRRSLWEKAGGHIDETFKFQIDCELWTRFFMHAKLWHVDCCLGGYRSHAGTRSNRNIEDTHQEALKAVRALRAKCDQRVLGDVRILRMISKLKALNKVFNVESLVRRLLPGLSDRVAYPRIVWAGENARWQKENMPFNLIE
ncbi:MAG: glycosyltransferase family 2 protein [bacterium]